MWEASVDYWEALVDCWEALVDGGEMAPELLATSGGVPGHPLCMYLHVPMYRNQQDCQQDCQHTA